MGRKNAARRKVRKNSQGEEGNSPQEKMPPNTQPVPEGIPISDNSVTSPPGKSPKTDMGESSVNSSSKHNPTSQASPEGAESKTSCPDTFKQLDNFQDSNSVIATTLADGGADMEGDDRFYKVQRKTETPESKRGHFTETSKREDRPVLRKKLDIIGVPQSSTSSVAAADMEDDSFYKVERKTETPESKRRSMKVSRSEVKLFTKNVPLKPKQSPAGDAQELKAALKNNKGEAMDKPKAEIDARLNKLKNIDEEPKAVVGRIADKISLFEHPAAGVNKQNSKTPRSADVSPVRKATEKPQSDYVLPDQRSRSAERYGTARSSSASPGREKPMTIKERARNFAETSQRQDRPALPQKPFMTGISKRPTSSSAVAASKSPELDDQGKRDTNEQIQKAKSEITKTKPDGRDPTAVGVKISIPEEQPIDSKTNNTVASKAAEQGIKPNRVETDIPSKEPVDSAELTNSISPQFKGPSRTGSRSKRRKSREPTSPISPNSENRSDCSTTKPELTAIKQHMDNTEEAASAPRQVTKEVSLPSDKAQGNTSDRQSLPDAKQKAFKNELKVVDKQKKPLEFSFKKENINKLVNRHEGLPEPSANKDTDTAVCSSGTKTPFDKDPVFLPQKDEKAVGHSRLFTERKEKEKANKDSKETSASPPIPAVERLTEKNALIKQEPPAADPKLEKELSMHSESRSKVRVREPNKKDTGQTTHSKDLEQKNHTKRKDVEGLEKVEGEKTNQTEKKYEETPQQLLHSDQKTTKTKVSDSRQGVSGTEGKAARDDENKDEAQTVKVSPSSEKTSSSPDLSAHKQHVCAVSQNNEAVSVTEREKVASKREQSTNVPPKILTKTTESPGTETTPVVIAAKPQPHSVSVEKTGNSPDDSCAHGANDVQFSKHITKATTAAETVTVKAADGPPALITAQTDMSEKESSVKGSTPIYVSKSVSSKGAGQDDEKKGLTVKSVPPEVKVSGNVMKPAPRQGKETQITESTSDITSLKGTKIAQSPSDSAASSPILNVVKKTADHLPITELSPVANGDIFLHPQLHTVKEELVNNKQRQSPKAPTSPQANKPIPESTQSSTKKKLHLPRGLSKDDSVTQQDAPSSWLDVDFPKRKLKIPVPKLSSSGSESNLLDTSGDLDDDDFIEKIKNLCAPFSLPPRKHSQLRPPQPPFAMPAIREDRFEKTFDPEEFKFGLRKENKFTVDTPPGLLAMLQNKETKSGLKPARASLADRSILLNSLDTHSRLRDSTPVQDEEDVKEDKDGQVKVKSRLEGSCVLSSLSSSVFRGKRNEFQTQAEGTSSGEVSPSGSPQLSPSPLSQPTSPSPTATAPLKDALSSREEAQAVVSDSGPPLPSFNDIKLPDYLEKYLPREPAKPVQGIPGQEQVKTEVIGKMATPASGGEAVRPGPEFPDAVPPCFPEIPSITHPTVPEPKQSPAQPQAVLSQNIRAVKGFHKRPGKIVLFEKAQFSGQAHEIYGDVANATSLQFSPLISVKTVRGCWVLYEKPDFQGRTIALEEGCTELTNVWAEPGLETEPQNHPPMLIGSIRLAVRDYNLPCIDLFTEPEGRGRVTPYHDDIIETGSFGVPLSTASIQVHSGVWLVFSDPGFQGMLTVLEAGEYPFPETWGFPSPFVGSLRPLKMGGFKVENPNEVKAVLYEKPDLDGACLEIDCDVFSFYESEGNITTDGVNFDSTNLKSVGSLKIIGGLWVGYSEPGFEGQQYILEEGEYLDCSDWGGSAQLLSLRPILSDFMSPHLKMFSERHFGELGMNIDLTVPVFNMDDTGYSVKTQSVDVISGVWVVFEEPGFCGECYILEKGLYGSPEDWGALQPRVASVMPVVLDDFENAAKFKVQLFSEPGFQGAVLPLEDSVTFLQDSFSVASCKVLAGSWLAFEGQDFTGRMYVLELGSYPDLRAMGCVNASSSILSLQTVGFEFSLPSITLFERGGLKGKRVVLTEGSVNLQLAGGCSRVQSVVVEGGMWVLYEGINYRGPQILLKPGEVPEWRKFSSWQKIGSLRPLIQKRVHFRLRNRQTGLMMSVTGDLDEVKLLRIQEMEENDGFEQIWFYQNGHLHCKLLEECCLSPSGSVMMAGCRVGLTPETDNPVHLWSITPEGVICYSPSSDLVLDVKGGHNYDKNQVILKTLDPSKLQQRWDVEII